MNINNLLTTQTTIAETYPKVKLRDIAGNNTSGCLGVFWNGKDAWRAAIYVKKKQKYLGTFKELKDAITARKEAEELYNYR